MVEQPPMVPSVPPLREEKKPMVDKTAPTQTQLENCRKRNINARECRCRLRAIAQMLNDEKNKENQHPNLIEDLYLDSFPITSVGVPD